MGVGEGGRGWSICYPLAGFLSSLIPSKKSVPLVTPPVCLAEPCPTPSPPDHYSVDHASRVSTWASTQAAQTVRAATLSPRMHQPGPTLGSLSASPTPGCCPQLGPIQVQGRVRGGAGGQETSPPSQGRPRPPSAAGEAVAMATPAPWGQRGRLPPGAGPDVSLGPSRRSGQFTAAGAARADCGAGRTEAGPAPLAPHRPIPAASKAAASTTSPQHTDSPPRTLTPADVVDGRAQWPIAEPATGSFDQWGAGGRGFFSPNVNSPADMRAKGCQDGDSRRPALWDL